MTGLSIRFIQHETARAFGLDPAMILSRRRAKRLARPRQVAMWLSARLLPGYSLPQIGVAFGGRDHTTVIHAVRVIDRMRDEDRVFRRLVDDLLAGICGASAEAAAAEQADLEVAEAERMALSVATTLLALARQYPRAVLAGLKPILQAPATDEVTP